MPYLIAALMGVVGYLFKGQTERTAKTETAQNEQSVSNATLQAQVRALQEQVSHFANDRQDHIEQSRQQAALTERVEGIDRRMTEMFGTVRHEIKLVLLALEPILKAHVGA